MRSFKDILISALALTVIAGCITAALAGTNMLTEDTIAKRTEEIENAARLQVIDADDFEEKTAQDDSFTYHIATKDGTQVGYVFVTESTGKSSGLTVMTGIDQNGVITGVVITDDNETAGYVDKIEAAQLPQQLVGKKAEQITLGQDVDAVSQATKTSKGVVNAVNLAIERYQIIAKEAEV